MQTECIQRYTGCNKLHTHTHKESERHTNRFKWLNPFFNAQTHRHFNWKTERERQWKKYILHSYLLTLTFMSQPNSFDKQIWQTNKQTNLSCVFTCVTEYCNVCNVNAVESFLILHQRTYVCMYVSAQCCTNSLQSVHFVRNTQLHYLPLMQ